jgi:hypothetical protein
MTVGSCRQFKFWHFVFRHFWLRQKNVAVTTTDWERASWSCFHDSFQIGLPVAHNWLRGHDFLCGPMVWQTKNSSLHDCSCQWLPDGIFFIFSHFGIFCKALEWSFGNGINAYFLVICFILLYIGFNGHLIYFPHFGILDPEKSGNPAPINNI